MGSGAAGGHEYQPLTFWKKLVCDYARISLPDVDELGLLDYLLLRHDAYIQYLCRTEAGQEYLDKAWRMEQTEPDRGSLRALANQEGGKVHGEQQN